MPARAQITISHAMPGGQQIQRVQVFNNAGDGGNFADVIQQV